MSCVIALAYYSARRYYTRIRELPSGRGFANLVFVPEKRYADKPALVVELKWNKSAEGAISQIKEKNMWEEKNLKNSRIFVFQLGGIMI